MQVSLSTEAPDARLADIYTRDLQWELERREGVQACHLGVEAVVEVVVDGRLWQCVRGPCTVTLNQD